MLLDVYENVSRSLKDVKTILLRELFVEYSIISTSGFHAHYQRHIWNTLLINHNIVHNQSHYQFKSPFILLGIMEI